MGQKIETKTVKLTGEERTWRVEIFCEKGDDPLIRAHREIVQVNAAGEVVQRDRSVGYVDRHLSAIARQKVAGLTGAKLAETIADWCDTLRAEDVDDRAEQEKRERNRREAREAGR